MEKNNLDTQLEALLLSKTFGELTAEEKKHALTFLTEEEYNEYHFLLSGSKAALLSNYHDLQPTPATLQKLKKKMADKAVKEQHHTIFTRLLYQGLMAAAMVIIVIGLVINLRLDTNKPIKDNKISQRPVNTTEPLVQKNKDDNTATQSLSQPKTTKSSSPVYNNIAIAAKATAKRKRDRNLCMDVHVAPTYLMLADTAANTPCLNTRLIIPDNEIRTDIRANR